MATEQPKVQLTSIRERINSAAAKKEDKVQSAEPAVEQPLAETVPAAEEGEADQVSPTKVVKRTVKSPKYSGYIPRNVSFTSKHDGMLFDLATRMRLQRRKNCTTSQIVRVALDILLEKTDEEIAQLLAELD